VVDQEIPDMVSDFFLCLFASLGTLLMICGVLPWFLLPVFPIIAVYWWIQQFYRKTSRGALHIPHPEHFSHSLNLVFTICAFLA
jgi:4-hydroxybenzoate polyprenyltransferase